MENFANDTIVAIATPQGRGGVGVIRVSGTLVPDIAKSILGVLPKPRVAIYKKFKDTQQQEMDVGIALYFPAPHSFTGENVLELQGHGGPVLLDVILKNILALGARLARPGEFSERAFINKKIDLAQAEAIADLIDAGTREAAVAAMRSLQGKFSEKIHALQKEFISLRTYVEAAMDFPEEEIDFLSEGQVKEKVAALIQQVEKIFAAAQQGQLLRDGMHMVILGAPNAGKSSLLNQLSGDETAIVTHIPGTTRDVLRVPIQIDGMPLHLVDTAGLRDSDDEIEQEGIRRAIKEMERADHVLYVVDGREIKNATITSVLMQTSSRGMEAGSSEKKITLIINKCDITDLKPQQLASNNVTVIIISAKTGAGINLLKEHLKSVMGYQAAFGGVFMARRRHLDALTRASAFLKKGLEQLQLHQAGELLAEDLRQAQRALSEITGEFTTDDLLGEIFSSFCIGK